MSMRRRGGPRLLATLGTAAAMVVAMSGCSGPAPGGGPTGEVTIEFAQWWEPELPAGSFAGLIDEFQKENPTIKVKLLSAPFASTQQQMVAAAASGQLPDVVGLDGAWVSDFAKQGAIADLSPLLKADNFPEDQLASQVKVNGKTYMIPVVNFVYPLFVNNDLLQQAGVSKAPTNRSEFLDAAKKISALGGNVKGWALPLDTAVPNGIQNDVMSWVWASGGSMLKNGKPDVTNAQVKSGVEYVKSLYDADVVAPGALTMKEQDKVEKFTNGQVGMVIDSLAHITLIKKNNPSLDFTVAALPSEDSYTGKRGIPYASWGIGVSDKSAHKAEAAKLVEFLMGKDVNAQLSTLANGFPGNKTASPDFSKSDPLFKTAFDIYQAGYPANEFVGLPKSDHLQRTFDEQLQKTLTDSQSVDQTLTAVQSEWASVF
ncbi:ABC transporter substrate-binding protein [Sinomonas mesophila]|uniref:ABC transporter substrate-binding protein n=1 Tax=Sinomonas mesophila TaxID=1531955 RepID=UPI000987BF1C|nr:sugar ABC transporter substrate-binding protein [Sinomonas mesophila]